jgi:hypothetical protein
MAPDMSDYSYSLVYIIYHTTPRPHLVGLWDIAAWRYDVMATFPCHRTAFLLSLCGYTLSTYLYMCGLSFMYIERSMEGRKILTVLSPAHYAALVQHISV